MYALLSDKHYVGLDLIDFEDTGKHRPISRVILHVDDDVSFTAGDDTGKTIEADCPSATQAMADALLSQLRGYEYRSYRASAAYIDPAAELGDGVTVGGIYSVISQLADDGGEYADLSAPGEAEIEEEYPYVGPLEREFNRKMYRAYSLIEKNSERITLEVGELRQETNAALDELSGTFNAELKKYSTIEMTNSSITAAVSESKNYTDQKTGAVAASLENYSTIEQTNSKISAAVAENKEYTNTSVKELGDEFDKTLGSLESDINAKFEKYSTIEQTNSSITAAVAESKKYTDAQTGDVRAALSNYSTVQQTSTSITAAVTESKQYADGRYNELNSEWTQTAEGFTASINGLNGKYAQLSSTVDGVSSTVVGLGNEFSVLEQTVDGLTITDENGTTWINGNQIYTGTVRADVLIGETVALLSAAGDVTGTLTITGADTSSDGAVQWDSIGALRLLSGSGAVYIAAPNYGGAAITVGAIRQSGVIMGSRITLGHEPGTAELTDVTPGGNGYTSLGGSSLRWKDVYAANALIQTSDLNMKTDVEYGLDKYDTLFDGLRPMSFRFIDGQSGRRHIGIGAQDVEKLMAECGITSLDFATFIKSPKETEDGEVVEGEYAYALRYSELIPLCIEQIQKLKARVRALEDIA